MKYQVVILFLIFSIVIVASHSGEAGWLDDLKESVEEATSGLEKSIDGLQNQPSQEQDSETGLGKILGVDTDDTTSDNSSSSGKSGKEIASSNAAINFFCPPKKAPDKLPNDMSGLEKDFGKSSDELATMFGQDNQTELPYILNLKQYADAFDGPEIKEAFNNFLNNGYDVRYLALIREHSLKKDHRLTWVRKADALFAYGLVHVYYQNVGGNAAKGYKLIRKAADPKFNHTQYGATYIEGTRRYNGYGMEVNLGTASRYMGDAYRRASNRSDNLALIIQAEFLRMVKEPDFPYKKLYADLLEASDSMRQALEQQYSASARSANPVILEKSRKLAVMRNDLLLEIGTIAGMGKDLEEFKVRAKQLKAESKSSNSIVEETIILGDGFSEKLKTRLGTLEKMDEQGLAKLETVHQGNEKLLYTTAKLAVGWFSYQGFQVASGTSGGLNMFETVEILRNLDGMTNRMCEVREAIIGFAKRTEVTIDSAKTDEFQDDI